MKSDDCRMRNADCGLVNDPCHQSSFRNPHSAIRHHPGFTLIELIVALVIMAVFAGMVMPAVSRAFRGAGLKTTGDKLCELLAFAHAAAVSRKRPVVVNIDPDRRLCWVTLQTVSLPWLDDGEDAAREERTLARMEWPATIRVILSRPAEAETDSSRIRRAENWETIAFRSDGRAADVLIELSDDEDKYLEIEITGVTGRARKKDD